MIARDPAAVAREGAAADAADDGSLEGLPRLARYFLMAAHVDAKARIAAEVAEMLPWALPEAAAWADARDNAEWSWLAAALDAAAVHGDRPPLRALADAVRCQSMTLADVEAHKPDALRVVASLRAAAKVCSQQHQDKQEALCDLEQALIGWTALVAADPDAWTVASHPAHPHARLLGMEMTEHTRLLAAAKARRREEARLGEESSQATQVAPDEPTPVPEDHVIVCPSIDARSNQKVRDAIKGHEHVVGAAMRLAPTPDVVAVRRELLAEFPYAVDVVDALLRPLVGRPSVRFPPVLVVGPPGCGKSRLARRLGEALGVGVWRTDGSGSGGSSFGGLERRWHSAEPAHPFLAVSRTRLANPLVLVDEIDKAPTRSDYGRLWDAMLGLLEPETAARFPDPCLQVDLDLSHVSYLATANFVSPLPSPLLDRLRVLEMPEPRAEDLDALLPGLMLAAAREQGLDGRWTEPLTPDERALLAAKWRGGSVRRLRGYLGVVLRVRDRERRRH